MPSQMLHNLWEHLRVAPPHILEPQESTSGAAATAVVDTPSPEYQECGYYVNETMHELIVKLLGNHCSYFLRSKKSTQ